MHLRKSYVSAFAFGLLFACSSSKDSSEGSKEAYAGTCEQLASRCHGSETELGIECHDLGHDGDEAKCGPRLEECLDECPEEEEKDPPDAGDKPKPDGGADADASAPSPECEAYCACMAETCESEPSYPFSDEEACITACENFSDDDRECFAMHCEDAKSASDKSHDCEHASGTVACH